MAQGIIALEEREIEAVNGALLPAFIAGYKAYKVGVTIKAAAFGIGGMAAVEALNNEDSNRD